MKINTNYQLNKPQQNNQSFARLYTVEKQIAEVLNNPAATKEVFSVLGNLRRLSDTVDTILYPINNNGRIGVVLRMQELTLPNADSTIKGWKITKKIAQVSKILLKPALSEPIYYDQGQFNRRILEKFLEFKKTFTPDLMPTEAAVSSEWKGTIC